MLGPRDTLPVDLEGLKRSRDAITEETEVIATGLVKVIELSLPTLYLGSGQSLTACPSYLQYLQNSVFTLAFVYLCSTRIPD